MKVRILVTVVTGIAFLFMVSTRALCAAAAAEPVPGKKIHVVAHAELHDAVLASSAEAAAARRSLQDLLMRADVQNLVERMGFKPATVAAGVALLSDSEIQRLHSQVMTVDQQIQTAGIPAWAIIVLVAVIAIGVALLVIGAKIAGG